MAALVGSLAFPAHAATTTYTSVYTGGTIAPGDTVLLNDGATVTGNVTANGTLQFNQSGTTLTISNVISGTGTLSLTNTGTVNLTGNQASGNAVFWDMTTAVSAGSLRILSGTGSLTGGDFYVGTNALGTLDVGGGLVSNAAGVLGYNAGGIGSATVSGGTWANSGDLRVGVFGSGTLGVNGGVVSNANARLGYFAGSVGTAMVSSGTWANSVDLYIGGDGDGTLTVNGGSVTSVNGWLGNVGAGAATVSGGTWVNSGALYVGSSGTGTLSVNGGFVTNGYTKLGYNAGSSGTATVMSGTLTTSNFVIVGERGEGALVVDGGLVANGDAILGWQPGSVGTATITGGTWATSGNLFVGDNGIGTLIVLGGRVSVAGTLSKGAFGRIKLGEDATLQIGVGGTTGVLDVTAITNNGTLVFNRSDDSTYSGIISGAGAVTKQAAGTLTFAGANSYSGLTTISAGTLALSGTGSIGIGGLNLGSTGSPGVFDLLGVTAGTYSLPSSASLAGVGTISGSGKSIAVLGSLAPGNSAGTITVGTGLSLDLSNSGSSVFEITNPTFTAGTYDLVSGDGSVVFGGILNLAFSGGSYADGTDVLQLFPNTGGRSGNFSAENATGLAAGQSATFNSATGFITVVPEPSTYAISAIATAGLASLMRWRKRRTRESTA
jgi:autotransporter-associated beta strand protein/T5SS/PEP-CTERM-associated repeat protein